MDGALADPTLDLLDATGALIASNDDWRDQQHNGFDAGGRYHDFQPADERESALAIILQPGTYTTIIRGKDGGTGVALAEVYDFSGNADSKLANISTRGLVQTGDNVLIGGLIVTGDADTKMILRAIGPSLVSAGITNALADPILELHDSEGILLGSNKNWNDNPQASEIAASGLAPAHRRESALVVTLPPGNYTATVRGRKNTRGVALFEAYLVQ